MVKTIIKTVFAISLFVSVMFFLAYQETHYTRTGHIINIDNGVCTFSDGTGNNWDFYSDTVIPLNAIVHANFFTNNTLDNIYDDQLVDYKIVGYETEISIPIYK